MATTRFSRLLFSPSRTVISFLRKCTETSPSRPFQHILRRSLAIEVRPSIVPPQQSTALAVRSFPIGPPANQTSNYQPLTEVLATIYKFPSLEPLCFEPYPASFLHLPLRRDILQRAVIYEGDSHRWGRAKTLWRSEVHGSGKKKRPQKGMGKARLGDKKSPMLRGGGVAHGPKPRDFSTELPRKIYNLAWRTALSWRYRRGTLVVVNGSLEPKSGEPDYMVSVLEKNRWDKPPALYVVSQGRTRLQNFFKENSSYGRVLELKDVDVKDLLESGRVIIEKAALDEILKKRGQEATSKFVAAEPSTMALSDSRSNRI